MNSLKYIGYDIVFQEVPNEVSLAINISGCPHHCEGCHSQYLWENTGDFICDDLDIILDKYKGMITCVCFMGGDQNLEELTEMLVNVKNIYRLKTCVYSGCDNISIFNSLLDNLDYLKVGGYKTKLGGLDSEYTNQRFYTIDNLNNLKDITKTFVKKG